MKKKTAKQVIYHPVRDTFLSRHHIMAKLRLKHGDKPSGVNILKLWRDRHDCWHIIFGLFSINEIVNSFVLFSRMNQTPQWVTIFGHKNDDECIALLKRVATIKLAISKRRRFN